MIKSLFTIAIAVFLSSCCCEAPSLTRDVFSIQYNESYQGQFDISGIYISTNYHLPTIMIFYDNGIVYFPDPNRHIDYHERLDPYVLNVCDIDLTGVNGEQFYWSFYEVVNNKIKVESLYRQSYPCDKWKTNMTEMLILNDSTLADNSTNQTYIFKLAKCYNKPDSIDYWRDK